MEAVESVDEGWHGGVAVMDVNVATGLDWVEPLDNGTSAMGSKKADG